MPQMANIVVKDEANVDVTFVALTPSSGDTTQAQWRADALGTTPAFAPALASKTAYNGPRTGRQVSINGVFPETRTVGGVEDVYARMPFKVDVTVPLNIPAARSVRNAKLIGNLVAAALVQQIISSGYNAT